MALRGVKAAREDLERRRSAGGGDFGNKVLVKIAKDEEIVARPLEDGEEFVGRYYHKIPMISKRKKRYTVTVTDAAKQTWKIRVRAR